MTTTLTYQPDGTAPPAAVCQHPSAAAAVTSAPHAAPDTFDAGLATWHRHATTDCPKCRPAPSLKCAAPSRD